MKRNVIKICAAIIYLVLQSNVVASQTPLDPTTLTKYIDAMPLVEILAPDGVKNGLPHYTLACNQFTQKVHTQIPDTTFWGYNSKSPGRMLSQPMRQSFYITYINNLPSTHIFAPYIPEVTGATNLLPQSRAVAHFHGFENIEASDGLPKQWINPGDSREQLYPNTEDRTIYSFYHDHAMLITRLNVYAGLVGQFLISDPADARFNLPGPLNVYDIPIAIQDKSFYTDGSQNFNMPDFEYDTAFVNGKVWPYLNVEPRKYLFRLLNTTISRFLALALDNGQTFQVIGSDGGFLEAPVDNVITLTMAPAEKYWIVVDFSTSSPGDEIVLLNTYNAGTDAALDEIMQFKVVPLTAPDTSTVPTSFGPITPTPAQLIERATYIRNITTDGPFDIPTTDTDPTDNNIPLPLFEANLSRFDDPITEMPLLGSTEIWNFINCSDERHPFHIHLIDFRILDRRPYNEDAYIADRQAGTLKPLMTYITGPAQAPELYEEGLKEVVVCPVGMITRVAMIWGPYAQSYMYHCHMLDHEEIDMMRPFTVLPAPTYFYELTRKYDSGPLLPAA